ncbi:uncharacterized protein YALI1_D23612g [Yarrowia lipolytica]|uniref:Uncharacterized protein n=1 Tax=Yarrowia lipolytica TaxID=4952 RepID=A0A1D8NF61_YARLL|nr:hypothetical protein YALI1_D23612g [Yarrowia lipolytica]
MSHQNEKCIVVQPRLVIFTLSFTCHITPQNPQPESPAQNARFLTMNSVEIRSWQIRDYHTIDRQGMDGGTVKTGLKPAKKNNTTKKGVFPAVG